MDLHGSGKHVNKDQPNCGSGCNQSGESQPLAQQSEDDGHSAKDSQPGVFHDLETLAPIPAPTRSINKISQTVQMK
jgi:hypothetical protein